MTPLPEPFVKMHGKHKNGVLSAESMDFYSAEQMTKHEAAGFKRGIEAAAKLCMDLNHGWCSDDAMTCAAEIRLLGGLK